MRLKLRKETFLYYSGKGTIANSLYHYPLYMRFFSSADRLEIDGIPFITTAPKPGRQEALEYYQGITRQRNINIRLYEKVSDVTKDGELFKVVSSKSAYTAKTLFWQQVSMTFRIQFR